MGYEPPGLEERPDDQRLAGFASLMPEPSGGPGLVGRLVRLPFKLLGLPFRLLKAVLRLPARLFGRRSTADTTD